MPIDDATQRQTPEETPTLLVASEPSTRARNLFTPGTLILNRYRIINHLGSGGMGDVYRADDLKLAQTVALKFIPRHLVAEPGVLAMLLSEVRIGREVSHPNVCRLYDVVEFEGHHFIAMQFVDGEDLASLLRRIGRLPVEKAIDIARDIAAGLAAAHELGVIHRDLKPANIMIDGRGRAHITDFGLAIVSGDSQRRGLAGTPIYMAPEQLSADEVTTATDVYAVGLILWEMLSGKRLYEPGTITQIAEAHNSAKSSLAAAVRDVPLKIDSLVMQCLDEDPLRRPRSARELLASLPGGDPLAAAMAAGDTPSPELVAAASMKGTVSLSVALMGLALFVAMMIAVALLTPHATLVSRERFRKPPEALIDRADEIVKASGIAADPADRAAAFFDLRRKQTEALDRDRVSFLYRRAATPLTTRTFNMQVTEDNPPFNAPGMANVVMSGDGRLLSFVAVPRVDAKPAPHAIDAMFLAAGYDRAEFRPVTPRFPPPVGADERLAWDGKVHVEAALYRGAPVWFAIDPRASVPQQMGLFGTGGVIWNLLYAVLVSLSCIFAWINVRRGSGDRRGAIRVAVALAIARIIEGVISMHLAGASFSEAATSIGGLALFDAVMFFIAYLALEPYVRRNCPVLLVSWQRLIETRWRDPLVARDTGVGLIGGMLFTMIVQAGTILGGRIPAMATQRIGALSSLRLTAAWIVHVFPESVLFSLWTLLFFVGARVLLRHPALYAPVFMIAYAAAVAPRTGSTAGDAICGLLVAFVVMMAVRAGGMLAGAVVWISFHLPEGVPLTFDSGAWYAGRSAFVFLLLLILAGYACFFATGRRLAMRPAAA